MNYEYKYLKYKSKYLNLKKIGGFIDGVGSYGVIYSNPRLPYLKKYNFDGTLTVEDDFNSENIQEKEVSKIFKKNYNRTNSRNKNINFFEEANGYIHILNHFSIPSIYFNIPLNYGKLNRELINSKLDIYNRDWASNVDGKYRNIYLDAKYQITFPIGISIKHNNFYDSILKFKNIIYAVKFMNEHNLVFDDLKKGNILEIDSKFKISDFSSLTHFSNINYEKYNTLNLTVVFYYIFSSLLNSVLYYYLKIKNGVIKKIDKIIDKINREFVKEESTIYIKYIDELLIKIKDFILMTHLENHNYLININYNKIKYLNSNRSNESLSSVNLNGLRINNTKINTKNNTKSMDITKRNIKIPINYIFDDILLFYKDEHTRNNLYTIYLEEMINYLDEKFENNIDAKINNLLKRINLYSLGITLLEILCSFSIDTISISNINIDKYKSLLEIIGLLTINIFKVDDHIYITEPNIDHVIQKYEEL
jgi:hypothetical protein